jgi:hypothetical protein
VMQQNAVHRTAVGCFILIMAQGNCHYQGSNLGERNLSQH